MKRIVAVIISLMLLRMPAFAEIYISDILDDFNIYAGVFDAPVLKSETADIRDSSGGEWSAKIPCLDNAIDVYFYSTDGSRVNFLMCTCQDDAKFQDFLAYCCASILYCYGSSHVTEMFGHLLFNYMEIRSGHETMAYISNAGDAFRLEFENNRYEFSAHIETR